MAQFKKILHLTYDMRIGGTEQVIKNLIEGMDLSQFDVSILCIEEPIGPFGEMLIEQGIKIDSFARQDGFDTNLIKQIRQYIKQHKIDVLHCHQYTPWVYGVLAAAFTKTKVIFTEHGRFYPDSSSWKRKLINPILVALTDHITVISKATKQALADFEYIPLKNVDVVYNGIAELEVDNAIASDLRSKYKIPDDAIVLGTIARLDPIKNQTMMLRAFQQVLAKKSNCYLLIVGDGDERTKLENLVDELTIRNNVIFTGYIAKPANHMKLMDIFLLPSLSEGTSMTLLEAMSIGKPCAVTDAGGNSEIILHEYNGLVSENGDADEFHKSLIRMVNDEHMLETFSINARKRFDSHFNRRQMTSQYEAIYKL